MAFENGPADAEALREFLTQELELDGLDFADRLSGALDKLTELNLIYPVPE